MKRYRKHYVQKKLPVSQKRLLHFLSALICTMLVLGLHFFQQPQRSAHSRRLLSTSCDSHPTRFEENKPIASIVYILGILYAFLAIAIVCDEHFMVALEKISEKLHLSEDVAGATFLAAAGSAPELFSNVSDTFAYSNSIGVGTIVGSAMFNILIIISASAVVAPEPLKIDWRPFVRDVIFYLLSITLVLIFFWDGKVFWWESLMFCSLYLFYILFMVRNQKILDSCCPIADTRRSSSVSLDTLKTVDTVSGEESDDSSARRSSSQVNHRRKFRAAVIAVIVANSKSKKKINETQYREKSISSLRLVSIDPEKTIYQANKFRSAVNTILAVNRFKSSLGQVDENETVLVCSSEPGKVTTKPPQGKGVRYEAVNTDDSPTSEKKEDAHVQDDGSWYVTISSKILQLISLPVVLLFKYTIPPCDEKKWENFFVLSFLISVVWIASISFAMVSLATWMGCMFQISPILMGVTVLAIGTSVPDAMGSMIAARNGQGGMACSNAIGSNVFDICFGLGIPWVIKSGIVFPGTYITVSPNNLIIPVLILFGTVLLVVLIFIMNRFYLTKNLGISLTMLYLGYVVYSLASGTS